MDCLYAECTPCLTDCVLAELEKLGQKYRVALKVAKVSAWLGLQHCQNKLSLFKWPRLGPGFRCSQVACPG